MSTFFFLELNLFWFSAEFVWWFTAASEVITVAATTSVSLWLFQKVIIYTGYPSSYRESQKNKISNSFDGFFVLASSCVVLHSRPWTTLLTPTSSVLSFCGYGIHTINSKHNGLFYQPFCVTLFWLVAWCTKSSCFKAFEQILINHCSVRSNVRHRYGSFCFIFFFNLVQTLMTYSDCLLV